MAANGLRSITRRRNHFLLDMNTDFVRIASSVLANLYWCVYVRVRTCLTVFIPQPRTVFLILHFVLPFDRFFSEVYLPLPTTSEFLGLEILSID